ncbi:MAG: glycoside hydrolase family 3 protein [Clostridia bacterium]|nr:glycoside hydrolase family 3 protein [Clostridia bacterium]
MKKPIIENMTLREKIAQSCLVRESDLLMHADTNYASVRPKEDAALLMEKYQFGGIWTHGNVDVNQMGTDAYKSFNFTAESHLEWLKEVEAKAKIPLICANDPGGVVLGLTSITSGLMVGASDDEELCFGLGRQLGLEHKSFGSNWIWAPMVDLVNRFAAGIVRPFSNEPDTLIRCARAYIKGLQSAGVAATAKHFPGADPKETRDGHIVSTFIRSSYEAWKKDQGRVFKELIDAGVYAIMAATRAFPAIDDTEVMGTYLPATLSHKIVTKLLKEEMGFEGVVITDDVTMGGYTTFYSHEDLYAEFLKAGNDVLLGVGVDAVDLIERAVLDGRLSEERVNDACKRVLNLKEKLGLFEDGYVRGNNIKLDDVKPESKKVVSEIANRGITLIKNKNPELLPLKKEKIKNVTIILYTHNEAILKSLSVMKEEFEKRGASVTLRRRLESWQELKEISEKNDLIVYVGYIHFHSPKGAPSFYGDEQWSFRYAFTAGKEKSIGISLGYPYIHYNFMDECPVFVNGYNATPDTQEAFVAAIYGEIPFTGKSPVDLNMN